MIKERQLNWSVLFQTVLMSSIVLGLLIAAVGFVVDRFFSGTKIAGSLEASGHLFVLWLVVSSAIRSINRLSKNMPGWTFLLAGILVTLGGVLIQEAVVYLTEMFKAGLGLKAIGFVSLPLFLGVGFVASLLSLINLRIKSRFWGNVLEILIIAAIIFLFFFFMK